MLYWFSEREVGIVMCHPTSPTFVPPPDTDSENATVARLRTSAQYAGCLRYSELRDLMVSNRRADVGSEGEQGGKEW